MEDSGERMFIHRNMKVEWERKAERGKGKQKGKEQKSKAKKTVVNWGLT